MDKRGFPISRCAITWKSLEAVEKYANKRYSHLDQRLISILEINIVKSFLCGLQYKNLEILDIPSGYGRFAPLLRKFSKKLVNGDLNIYALLYQKKRLGDEIPKVIADALKLPFRDCSFDCVFNFRLIQHFDDREIQKALVNELARVTSRYLIISVYHSTIIHKLIRIITRRPKRIFMISFQEWKSLLKKFNLKIIKKRAVLPFLHAQHIYLLEKISVAK